MKFYFCEKCGRRITEADIQEGLGRNKKLRGVYCQGCAAGVLTLETLPLTNQEARQLLHKPGLPDAAPAAPSTPPKRKTSAIRTPLAPPVSRREAGRRTVPPRRRTSAIRTLASRAPGAPGAPDVLDLRERGDREGRPAKRPAVGAKLFLLFGLAVGLLGLLALWAVSGPSPASRKSERARAGRPKPDSSTLHVRVQNKPPPKPSPKPNPKPMAPTMRPPVRIPAVPQAQPAAASPEERAQRAFAKLTAFAGLPAADQAGRIKRIQAFLAEHGKSIVAARARALLRKLQHPVSALPKPQPAPKPAALVKNSKPAAPKPVPPKPAVKPLSDEEAATLRSAFAAWRKQAAGVVNLKREYEDLVAARYKSYRELIEAVRQAHELVVQYKDVYGKYLRKPTDPKKKPSEYDDWLYAYSCENGHDSKVWQFLRGHLVNYKTYRTGNPIWNPVSLTSDQYAFSRRGSHYRDLKFGDYWRHEVGPFMEQMANKKILELAKKARQWAPADLPKLKALHDGLLKAVREIYQKGDAAIKRQGWGRGEREGFAEKTERLRDALAPLAAKIGAPARKRGWTPPPSALDLGFHLPRGGKMWGATPVRMDDRRKVSLPDPSGSIEAAAGITLMAVNELQGVRDYYLMGGEGLKGANPKVVQYVMYMPVQSGAFDRAERMLARAEAIMQALEKSFAPAPKPEPKPKAE